MHLGFLLSLPLCIAATWWQITRAEEGNDLSYVYSVMWPVFAVLTVYFWWMLLHTDYDTVGLKGMRRQQEAAAADDPGTVAGATPDPDEQQTTTPAPAAAFAVEDPELAAYNARLAELASKGPKTWRAREKVVVRREQ